ncbi:MAG: D-isomer specific 2-hydroxyacid dehydrogenase family protein [Candidatus Gastranaerophilales bacterium]|nr:D-isomer specific 2-hydroxyacid dehydrogenase family protein [Candidatus Gastranaerophilales bacterium]
MKIFAYCLRDFDETEFYDKYCEEFGGEYAYTGEYPGAHNMELARGYDAISVTPCDLSAPVLEKFYELGVRYITTRSIGYDHIDLKKAKELGMGVCHVSYAPETVADYAIMLILMCCRNICHILDRAAVQDYTLKGKMGRDLCDCTVGVIGTGQIGSTVLRHLSSFGCRLLAYDLFPKEDVREIAEYVPLEELYAQSDVITLHAPATAENYHMLNEQAFRRMKKDVILVNTARGTLIDTAALIDALEQGRIGHAALDVLEQEDGLYYANRMGDVIANRDMAILRSFPNVILSPHTAFYTRKVVQDMAYKSIKGVRDMMDGRENPLVIL